MLGLAVSFHRVLLSISYFQADVFHPPLFSLLPLLPEAHLRGGFDSRVTQPHTSGISGPMSISFLTHSELFLVLGGASDCLLKLDTWVPRRTLGLLALLCWEGGAAVLPQVGDKSRFLRV